MTTTGTTSFNLDMNDLIEESFERCGLEVRSGYDFPHCTAVFKPAHY
jgi:hypothetical protein